MQQSLLIPALLGDHQGENALALADVYSSGGSLNLYMDKYGRLRPVLGYEKVNSGAHTTDTGGSAAKVVALHFYEKRGAAGALTQQLLFVLDDAVNEWELYKSTDEGATKTLLVDAGAGSVGSIPSFAQLGDELFIANGVFAPKLWDGTTLSTAGGTQLAAPTLASVGTGPLTGNYKYRLVPIKASKVRKVGSIASASLNVSAKGITVTITADADGTVIGYELYRTSGTGLDYYLVQYIDGRTPGTFDDYLPDADLINHERLALVASHGDPPPTAYYAVAHKSRIWWIRTDTLPRVVYWSDPGDGDSVQTERAFSECTDARSVGDVNVGGTGEFQGMLVVWQRQNIWTFSGTGTIINNVIDWKKRRSDARIGTLSIRTVARVSRGAVYIDADGSKHVTPSETLAFLTPENDIRLFDGNADTIISFPMKDTLARITQFDTGLGGHSAFVFDDASKGLLVWVVPVDGGFSPSIGIAWSYVHGTWHVFDHMSYAHGARYSSGSVLYRTLVGEALTATGGYIYKLWETGAYNADIVNGVITSTFTSKPIYPPTVEDGPPDIASEKRLEVAHALHEIASGSAQQATVYIYPHGADVSSSANATVGGTTTFSPMVARTRFATKRSNSQTDPGRYFYGIGFRVQIVMAHVLGVLPTINGFQFLYTVLRGRKR